MLFRQQGRSLVVHTPAKLNLFLEVLDRRTDGYHELETLMVSVGLYDTLIFAEDLSSHTHLRVARREAPSLRSQDDVPAGAGNLIVRAADLLRTHYPAVRSRGVRIDLYKRIPVAGGLGGGSSDAAATLWGLNRFWNLGLSRQRLQELAAQLGSDVSFFLGPTAAAVCRGRGELIEPITLPLDLHFVMARPRSGLSTAAVYQHCRPAESPKRVEEVLELLQHGQWGLLGSKLHNALQPAAEALNPEVPRLKRTFARQPVLGHLMSGSGTTWFGLCAHRRQAKQVAARLKAISSDHVVVARSRP